MYKLKVKEKKKFKIEIAYIAGVKFINTSNPYLLPLFGSLNFNFSFSMLPNVIFNNTLAPFLWSILSSLLVFI